MGDSDAGFSIEPKGSVSEWQLGVLQHVRELGPDHETTLVARLNLAHHRGLAGDVVAALVDSEIVAARCQAVLGDAHPATLGALAMRAYHLGATGDRPGAVAIYERLIPALRHHLGADHMVTLSARYYLAAYRDWTNLSHAAVEAYQGLLADYRRVVGMDHLSTAHIADELAKWQTMADEDVELSRELHLDFEASDLGVDELTDEDRDDVLVAVEEFRLGRVHLVSTVDEWLDRVADVTRRLGADHEEAFDARRQRAVARMIAEDRAGAEAELDGLLADQIRALGPDDDRVRRTRAMRDGL